MAFEKPDELPHYEPKFGIGDVVILNGSNSGPLMTVKNYLYSLGRNDQNELGMMFNGIIVCQWFDATRSLKEGKFHQQMISKLPAGMLQETESLEALTNPSTVIIKN